MTWFQDMAWVDTCLINASMLARTVTVRRTFRLRDREALLAGVPKEARRTATESFVVCVNTVCLRCTGIIKHTRINTLLIYAGSIHRTVCTSSAPNNEAFIVAITL